jgi:CVNH domain
MRYSITLGVFAVAMVLCLPSTASAAPWDGPPGTYVESCRNIRMHGDTLYARCRNTDNRWIDTSLDDVYRCVGDITNINGRLECARGRGLPQGDYAQTCRDINMRFNTLYARCKTADGYWVETSLEGYSRCTGAIANVNGQLRCPMERDWDRDRYWRGAPAGNYRETCRDIRVDGYRLRARCETMNGYWRDAALNDFNRCVGGSIVNADGRLACTRTGGRQVPRGSYTESCSRIYVEGDTLRAMCQTGNGAWVWSQLNDWDDCRGGIWNENGQLRCRRDR